MPHLTVHALETQLAGCEQVLVSGLTAAVVSVYGEWVRELVVVRLEAVPSGRWGVGGRIADAPAPEVRFGIRSGAFERPDWPTSAALLVDAVTAAVAAALGEQVRDGVLVELVPQPDDRTAVGGTLVSATS